MAAGSGRDPGMANVQHAVGKSVLAECPDTGRNRRCGFDTSLRFLLGERLSNRLCRR